MIIDHKEQMTVEVDDEYLTIRIGINLLCHAVQHGEYSWDEEYRITDNKAFAEDIAKELLAEEEDGTTRVHRMFDAAANEALENGSLHVEEVEDDEDDFL